MKRLACALALLSSGCTVEGSLGKDGGADETAGGTAASEGTAQDGSSDGAATGEASSAASTGHASTTDASTHGSESGAGPCDPAMADDACVACTKTSCCDPLTACQDDPVCVCVHACHDAGTPLPDCLTMCGDDGGLAGALETCMHDHCAAACA